MQTTAQERKLTKEENYELDQEYKKRAREYCRDVLVHVILGLSAVAFFSVAALFKGKVGEHAMKALDLFVGGGLSINVALLTATIFLWGVTLIFDGARVARLLQTWLVMPGLTFFQLSCAVGLGICIAYFFLIFSGVKPKGELGSLLSTVILMTVILGVQISMRCFFEVFARKICELACTQLIQRLFSRLGRTQEQANLSASKCVSLVIFATGLMLVYTASLQLPVDLEHAVRSAESSSVETCVKANAVTAVERSR
ncbi:hypothetical protein RB25_09700 [Herbaspirillum rubrisubalbicans]|uniref:hypothetical protein n=1 Tax=Herbaspirillum rubrisubalbicans TaxID=80842 RepID=UPI000DC3EF89|nr:hypothetical protein [Herbaspirillum rubrisubalbicans]RAN48609.1 hypothetical protein RB25_09700 [Herbaspirillum rubrisubalbicans]